MTDHVPKDPGEFYRQQNTHWYRSGWAEGRHGYTANPYYADPGEVERVGLHECFTFGCEEIHAYNGDFWRRILLYRELRREASQSTRGHRSEGVQGLPERRPSGYKVLRRSSAEASGAG